MKIKAVIFDIGGVLEITPRLGVAEKWAIGSRMDHIWAAGSIGTISEQDVHDAACDLLGLDEDQVNALMGDLWTEYLGTGNTELIEYCRGLRPLYKTGILSNSFVGARRREQELYGFEELVDDIVYSHESGMSKPDVRIYRRACERLAVRPEETIFLDDVDDYVEGARQAGLNVVRFANNAQAIADIETLLR